MDFLLLQFDSHLEINRKKHFRIMLHFRNILKGVRICKIGRAETSLNNALFSKCSQCIAQCSVMNEYAEDLHGNDILDIETKTILQKIWIKMMILKI